MAVVIAGSKRAQVDLPRAQAARPGLNPKSELRTCSMCGESKAPRHFWNKRKRVLTKKCHSCLDKLRWQRKESSKV